MYSVWLNKTAGLLFVGRDPGPGKPAEFRRMYMASERYHAIRSVYRLGRELNFSAGLLFDSHPVYAASLLPHILELESLDRVRFYSGGLWLDAARGMLWLGGHESPSPEFTRLCALSGTILYILRSFLAYSRAMQCRACLHLSPERAMRIVYSGCN